MTQGTSWCVRPKKLGSRCPRSYEPFRPDMERRARAEGLAGRFKRLAATPGSARTSFHPGLLSCHHSVVRRRGFGPSKVQISLARLQSEFVLTEFIPAARFTSNRFYRTAFRALSGWIKRPVSLPSGVSEPVRCKIFHASSGPSSGRRAFIIATRPDT